MPPVFQMLKHLLSPRRWKIPLIGVLVGGLITWLANTAWLGSDHGVAWWWADWLDPWITMTTLAVAGFLGIRAWVDELPKRLNVHFVSGSHYALTCWEASLGGEGDIRQWAQQIGMQMAQKRLDFDPYPSISAPRILGGPPGLRQVYEITISLTTEPPEPGYRVWGPGKSDNEYIADRPQAPMTVEQVRGLTAGTADSSESS